ncbi:GNAT family N-acetyltransferase [Streptomyces sp. NBC_01525]|uniref:GNAT family N-acetyltransferase n=1 Tax=Streptomyces benahoarensis TaxID=2595054 RepID=A0A553ZR14_9ACTN|nr:GNAT family N-acetyltransferase [Streptomyces benahoarensis]TSB32800.1 GNAT family N-acetyltransferase [Streptomyces benahoarensis]TSB43873.1 GNAT family N-acetyltransferase [Streptomyces benahoarensis]
MTAFRAATARDLPDVAATLTEAFADDPPSRWVFPGGAAARARFFSDVADHVHTVGGTVELVPGAAALLALPPGVQPPDDPADGREAAMRRTLDACHPHAPHHYLLFYGVRDAHRGRGLGGRMLARLTARADRDRTGTYAEASTWRGARLMLRHGFRPTGTLRLPDGTPLIPVWRDPP